MLYNVLTKIQPEYHVGSTSCARWAICDGQTDRQTDRQTDKQLWEKQSVCPKREEGKHN